MLYSKARGIRRHSLRIVKFESLDGWKCVRNFASVEFRRL